MNGNYNSAWGWNNWGNSAFGWGAGIGIAAWGIGSMLNTWGYTGYANPYYTSAVVVQQPAVVVQQPVVYDYSRPLDLASAPPPDATATQAVGTFDTAREAFRAGDYDQALAQADQALRQLPNDPMLHEFRAICLFALRRYDQAAVPLYTVLSAGPGWDWTTLVGLYPSVDVYTGQLRALEDVCNATPSAAAARFVLASLYMTQGDNASAAAKFKEVAALQPQDKLAPQLADALTPKPESMVQPAPAQTAQVAPTEPSAPAQPQPAAAPAQADDAPAQGAEAQPPGLPRLPTDPVPDKLMGTWTAIPANGVTIALSLDTDKGFSWKVTDHGQTHEFKGSATFGGDALALAASDQPPMVGTVSWKDDSHFQFKALGAPPSDPGLSFGK
jgi:tetratricopeptide (TPR) repeat protein